MSYNLKYTSKWKNRADHFRLEIFQKNFLGSETEIQATANLNAKEVDSAISTIRGLGLNIRIDASIDEPLNEFFIINEKEYLVKFYRNEGQMFEGFVDPKGVSQPFVQRNWNISLVATDQLASLSNLRFNYDNELPNEFTFLYKILKRTGLDLPIAFFDDVNLRQFNNGSFQLQQGKQFWRNDQRIIRPDVFVNDNGRFASCEEILNDILKKYNFSIKQELIPSYKLVNFATLEYERAEDILCWLVYRVDAMKTNDAQVVGRMAQIIQVDGFEEGNLLPFQNIKIPQLRAQGLWRFFKLEETTIFSDHEISQNIGFNDRPPHHVNANQQIRYDKALQNFRFEQRWKTLTSWIDYNFNNFLFVSNFVPESKLLNINDNLGFVGYGNIFNNPNLGLQSFNPVQPIENQGSAFSFVKYANIEVPEATRNININGNALIKRPNPSNQTSFFKAMSFIVVHNAPSGNRYLLQGDPQGGSSQFYTTNQIFVQSDAQNAMNGAFWELDSEIQPDSAGILGMINVSNTLFTTFGNGLTEVDFEINLPTTQEDGGTFELYLSSFFVRTSNLSTINDSLASEFNVEIKNINFKVLGNPDNGIGEYHDQERKEFITTNLEDPVEVINADEVTNLYLNGLQEIVSGERQNYESWYLSGKQTQRLLNGASWERINLKSRPQLIFEGDVYGFIPYFTWVTLSDFPDKKFVVAKYNYKTLQNITSVKLIEVPTGLTGFIPRNQIDYENSFIFEEERNVLISAE